MQAVLNTCLSFTSKDLNVSEAGGGAVITSVLLIGAAAGGFFAGQVADCKGPCRTLQWNNVPLLAGSLLGAVAPRSTLGFWSMLLGSFVCLLLGGQFLLKAVTDQLVASSHSVHEQLAVRKSSSATCYTCALDVSLPPSLCKPLATSGNLNCNSFSLHSRQAVGWLWGWHSIFSCSTLPG